MSKRVVVTGMGAISPVGNSVNESWAAVRAGKSGITTLTKITSFSFPTNVAAQLKNFDINNFIDKKLSRKMADFTQFFVAASVMAIQDSKLLEENFYSLDEVGVIIGNGVGGFSVMEEATTKLINKGPNGVPPLSIPKLIINEGAANLAMLYGFNGPAYGIVTACSSGGDAIGNAVMAIQADLIDVVIAGGSEASITPLSFACFSKLQTLSTSFNDRPTKASRPFDRDRDGFVMGEGGASLVLESYENAKKRGAHIYAEIAGYGMTCDAYHLTSPMPRGEKAIRAMQKSMKMAGIEPKDVGYVNAHGTSTKINDITETKAMKGAFGSAAKNLKISSTKSMTGHMIGAGGVFETIMCIKALEDQFVPPTLNLDNPDEGCDLDYIPNKGEDLDFNIAMSNSLGFGGHNCSIVVKKVKD